MRPEGRAPAHDGKLAARSADFDLLLWDEVGDALDLGFPRVRHLLVVGGIVGDFTARVIALDAADPVGQAGRPWLDPDALQRLGIAHIGIDPPFGRHLVVELRRRKASYAETSGTCHGSAALAM